MSANSKSRRCVEGRHTQVDGNGQKLQVVEAAEVQEVGWWESEEMNTSEQANLRFSDRPAAVDWMDRACR